MLRLLKTLLISFMMLALPVQGLAAAIGTSCGPAHRHDMLDSLVSHEHKHSADSHVHEHPAATAALEQDHNDNPGAAAGKKADPRVSASTCSACAACCVGAVIPPSILNHSPSGPTALVPLAASVTPLPGYLPEGPRRPPKVLLV